MSKIESKRTHVCLRGFFLKYVVHLLIVIVAVQGLPFWKLSQGQQRFQGASALELVLDRLGCSTAEAGEVSVFGPEKYVRTTGKPNIYTDRFSAQAGIGTVVVVNGEADGSHRVSSAIVTLNGRNILKTTDFNQNVYLLRVVVDLAALNTLVVELRSKPDSFLTIEILAEKQNNPPVADAGPDQTVFAGDTVTLDGSASSDVDGDPLTYAWSFTSVPPGSSAALSDPAAVKPTFTVDKPGTYAVQLIVNDGYEDSAPDTVTVTTQNSAPVANAGPDQTVYVGDTVTLDGSKSSDVDGDLLTHYWSFTAIPPGSAATLSYPAAVKPTFVVDKPGTYVVQLIVNDGYVDSAPDTVTITTENSPPVANAGPDQTVYVGDTVTLDGSASTDVDGDLLTFYWSFAAVPPGGTAILSDPAAVKPTFVADKPGTYVVQLIVNDGYVDSAPDSVSITTENSPPVANAGPDQTVYVGDTVTLDGSASTDVDGDLLTFYWSFTAVPPGSTAILSDPAAVKPTFVADKPGTYVVQLIVNDGYVDSAPDSVSITTENSPPMANAGPDQSAFVGQVVVLDGSSSSDADGDPLTCAWSFTSLPPGSATALSDPTVMDPAFVPDLPGLYVVQLIVNDGTLDSFPDTSSITANIRMTNVPDLTGLPQASAESALTAANLIVGMISQANSAIVPIGNVITQNPPAGTSVPEGSAVALLVSLGPLPPPPGSISVGPSGGTLEFPNGVILEVPAGAVNETVDIEITDLSCDVVNAIILSQELATHKKRCLRGFSAKPDGLFFNVPIKAIIPVSLQPGEIPVQIEVDVTNNVQWTIEAELVYQGITGVVEVNLEHFSEEWLAALLNHIDDTCSQCSTYSPEVCGPLASPHPYFDNHQPGACLLLNAEREKHDCKVEGLRCCMELQMDVQVTEADFTAGKCHISSGKVNVTFPACTGSPTIPYEEAESSGCPPDAIYKIAIVSNEPWIYRCREATLKAELSATTKDGIDIFKAAAFPAEWEILPGGSTGELGQDVGPNGKVVTGLEEGNLLIHASAVGRKDISGDFTLPVKKLPFVISPEGNLSISVGESGEFEVPCVVCPEEANWETDNLGVVRLTIVPGWNRVRVTGIKPGTAKVFAKSQDHCGETIEDSFTVNVNCDSCTFQVKPSSKVLILGNNSTTLRAELLDVNGNPVNIPPTAVTWTSDSSGVSLSAAHGLQTTVTPNDEGPATITATYTDPTEPYGQKTATAIIRVRSFQGLWDTEWEAWDGSVKTNTPMRITVSEGYATGTYHYSDNWSRKCCAEGRTDGTIDGQISDDGHVLIGTWYEGCTALPLPDCGVIILPNNRTIEFLLSSDGNSFTGTWTGVHPVLGFGVFYWNGVRRVSP